MIHFYIDNKEWAVAFAQRPEQRVLLMYKMHGKLFYVIKKKTH